MNRDPDQPTTESSLSPRLRLMYLTLAAGGCIIVFALAALIGELPQRLFHGDDYLVFHLIIEFVSIVFSFAIFTIGWYGYKQRPDTRNLVLALAFFIVGCIDFLHALSFQGMPEFLSVNSADKSAAYWIVARLVAALGLLAMPFIPGKRLPAWLRPRLLLALVALFVIAIALLVARTSVFPRMFVEGEGLTTAKMGLEYLVILLELAAIAVLWRKTVFDINATTLLQAALVLDIFSEVAFTIYADSYDSYALAGHLFKTVSYYLILRAIFVSSLREPYQQLKQARVDLERSFDSIGMALSSSLELNSTLDLIVRLASDLLRSPSALVALQQRESDSLTVLATHGLEAAPAVIPLRDNLAAKVWHDQQPVWIDELNAASQPYPSVMRGEAFNSALAAPILKDDSILGEIAVYSKQHGAFTEADAQLLASFARQAAVAIENARLYQTELLARDRIESYLAQLAVLHNIGLSLNRETDRDRLLKMVLASSAELTSAGVGLMMLIVEGETVVVSQYYADWYEQRCEIGDKPATLHQRVNRLIADADATRVETTSGLQMLPAGHVGLRGLLIGKLRDTRGNILGYFLLSDKEGGADFTSEDEELISLLAAQSSVALVSADSFEKEHRVAESLQAALLPKPPVRDDVEVGLLYKSAGAYGKVGGDFYDFIDLGEHNIAVIVGDVCGKGMEAAKYTAMVKYMLRAYLSENLLPGDCLTRLNQSLSDQLPAEKFITAAVAVIDTEKKVIAYASAGHPPMLRCVNGKADYPPAIQTIPLGVLPDYEFPSTQVSMVEACSIFMYSDGLIEARPEGGEPFGEQRLKDKLSGLCGSAPRKIASEALKAAVEYSGGELRDDIAIVAVRLRSQTCQPNT